MIQGVIARSLWRKLAVTCVAIVAFVLLYEAGTIDSRDATPQRMVDPTLPAPGSRLLFTATAYCKGTTTTSGVGVRTGIAASDPAILPVGSVINVSTDQARYNGVYTIMDTGPRVQGRIIDVFIANCSEARVFGRRSVELTVLRLGWSPAASTPSLIDRLFRRREAARPLPAPPVVPPPPPADVPAMAAPTLDEDIDDEPDMTAQPSADEVSGDSAVPPVIPAAVPATVPAPLVP